jgi:hypothetical protein
MILPGKRSRQIHVFLGFHEVDNRVVMLNLEKNTLSTKDVGSLSFFVNAGSLGLEIAWNFRMKAERKGYRFANKRKPAFLS